MEVMPCGERRGLPGGVRGDPRARRARIGQAAGHRDGLRGLLAVHGHAALPGACPTQHPRRPDQPSQTPGGSRAQKTLGPAHEGGDLGAGGQMGRGIERLAHQMEGLHRGEDVRGGRPRGPEDRLRTHTVVDPPGGAPLLPQARKPVPPGPPVRLPGALTAAGRPVARTSNRLESGLNAAIKRMLLIHHGMPLEHERRACEWLCYMRISDPRSERFIAPARPRPQRTADDTIRDAGVAEHWGTGIEWNDLHTTTPYPYDTD